MNEIIAGKGEIYGIFTNNGYSNYLFAREAAFVSNKCFVSECINAISSNQHMLSVLFDNIFFTLTDKRNRASHNMQSNFYRYLDYFVKSPNNYFAFLHFHSPGHAKSYSLAKGLCNEERETENYRSRLIYTNELIYDLINKIDNIDPNALVIIASDHGPYIFNGCSRSAPLATREEVVERQGAFLAIKWGKDYDGRYDKNIKSSANLFRYIFSHLSRNEKLLENRADDDAYYLHGDDIILSIDDGVILPPARSNSRSRNTTPTDRKPLAGDRNHTSLQLGGSSRLLP